MGISAESTITNSKSTEVVNINGHDFLIPKLSAREQFHLSSKVGVLVFSGNVAEALAKLSENDLDVLFDSCLRKVKCKDNQLDVWTPILTDDGSEMFDWLDCKTCFELIGAVVNKNLGNFFTAQTGDGRQSQVKQKKGSR